MTEPEQPPSTTRTLVKLLWFPAFFVVGFMVFYLLPFHAAKPHDMPVAVVGDQAATSLSVALDRQSPNGFRVQQEADASAARQAVLDREVVAAYDPASQTLIVAGADGAQLTQVAKAVFEPVAEAGGGTLKVVDVAPSAPGDALGTTLFYITMAWNICGYIVVMMLMQAPTMSRRTKLVIIAGFGALATIVAWLFALSVNAIGPNPAVLLVGFLLTQVVGWTTLALAPFVRPALPGVAMGLFVLLSIPSSGGAIPKEMVPQFFQALHHVMPLGNAIDAVRSIMYFGGHNVMQPVLVLVAWWVAAVGFLALDSRLGRRRAARAENDIVDPDVPVIGAPHAHPARTVLGGHVLSTAGRAVPGAVVTITDTHGRQLDRVQVDEGGRYSVSDLAGVVATVVVSAPEHLPVSDRVHLEGRPQEREYRMVPAGMHLGGPRHADRGTPAITAATTAGSASF